MVLGKVVREEERRLGVSARGGIGRVGAGGELRGLGEAVVHRPRREDLERDLGETVAELREETDGERRPRCPRRRRSRGRVAHARFETHDPLGVGDVAPGVRATGPDHHERPFAVRIAWAGEIAGGRRVRDRT